MKEESEREKQFLKLVKLLLVKLRGVIIFLIVLFFFVVVIVTFLFRISYFVFRISYIHPLVGFFFCCLSMSDRKLDIQSGEKDTSGDIIPRGRWGLLRLLMWKKEREVKKTNKSEIIDWVSSETCLNVPSSFAANHDMYRQQNNPPLRIIFSIKGLSIFKSTFVGVVLRRSAKTHQFVVDIPHCQIKYISKF